MSQVSERFAKNLKWIRIRQGVGQEVMAGSIGVKRSTYSGYENGAAEPSLDTLSALQERYGVGIDMMLSADLYLLTEWQWHQLKSSAGLRKVAPTKQEA